MNDAMQEPAVEAKPSPMLVPGAIVVAGLIIAGAVYYSSSSDRTVSGPEPEEQVAAVGVSDEAKALLEAGVNDFVLGNPEAGVTLVEFADFQCPYCAKLFRETLPQVKEKYIKTGQVKLVFRDFAFLGEESFRAAEAARCAGDQGKFWDYHDYLYSHQRGENEGAFGDANLKKFADALKLDRVAFDACFDSGAHRDAVEGDSRLARELKVTGTPTTFINGTSVTGAVPFSELEQEIQAALAKPRG